ncbi:hypothetical protein Tco_0952410 [Tanacetum coccineum]|uniref:Uncharacterized protein n=1 Tax=Tanacetum coccineum TaxID=301880 RepID=A0ABQ5DWZ7_9ASTR
MQPVDPPSPDYVPGPEHPPSPIEIPFVPEPEYPEYLSNFRRKGTHEDQPYPLMASPVPYPRLLPDSDPEEIQIGTPRGSMLIIPCAEGIGEDSPSDDDTDDDDAVMMIGAFRARRMTRREKRST